MSERLTNDYAALVAMLDQAAADLQAEIDAAIDRHGLLARTANQLRAEADGPNVAAEPGAILSVHERCTQEQRDALAQRLASDNRWQYVIDPANNTGRWTIQLDGRAQTGDADVHAFHVQSGSNLCICGFPEDDVSHAEAVTP